MQSKNKCIYTKKDDTTAEFKNSEHIFPASIGGIKTLPKGYVCDEVNNMFSKYEMEFAREFANISLYRTTQGVGKRGKSKKELLNAEITEDRVKDDLSYKFNINNIKRVVAKIAFNTFAEVMGQDFILSYDYDGIRKAIVSGSDIDSYVYLEEPKENKGFINFFKTLEIEYGNDILSNKFHYVVFNGHDNCQKAAVGFFGSKLTYFVILSKNPKEYINEHFICDWEQKKEMKMTDFIISLLDKKTQEIINQDEITMLDSLLNLSEEKRRHILEIKNLNRTIGLMQVRYDELNESHKKLERLLIENGIEYAK